MDVVTVRPARTEELSAVADLRWQWTMENDKETPVTTREQFRNHFVEWARDNAASHTCFVLLRGTRVIGMAWLAITNRVPGPAALWRAAGDMQCVYVIPEERNTGLGSLLVDAVNERAKELGLERVTVHSSSRAVSAYARYGYAVSPKLLQIVIGESPRPVR